MISWSVRQYLQTPDNRLMVDDLTFWFGLARFSKRSSNRVSRGSSREQISGATLARVIQPCSRASSLAERQTGCGVGSSWRILVRVERMSWGSSWVGGWNKLSSELKTDWVRKG